MRADFTKKVKQLLFCCQAYEKKSGEPFLSCMESSLNF